MHNNDTKAQFIELRAKGWSLLRVAAKLGVSKRTLVLSDEALSRPAPVATVPVGEPQPPAADGSLPVAQPEIPAPDPVQNVPAAPPPLPRNCTISAPFLHRPAPAPDHEIRVASESLPRAEESTLVLI